MSHFLLKEKRLTNFFSNLSDCNKPPNFCDCEIDLMELSHSAMMETLHSRDIALAFRTLFPKLLKEYSSKLIWKNQGVGIGREIKRAYSAIFGRVFARYYLTKHAGVQCLIPIESRTPKFTNDFELQLSRSVPKGKKQKVYLPDWIGYTEEELVIAEAKGSHKEENWRNNFKKKKLPNCLIAANRQVNSLSIKFKTLLNQPITIPFSGWSVASQWSTEENKNEPWLVALKHPSKKKVSGKLKVPYETVRNYLEQNCIISVLDAMGHFGYQRLQFLGISEKMNGASYIESCTLSIKVNQYSLKGVFSVIGPFGILPIQNFARLYWLRNLLLDRVYEENIILVMLSQNLLYLIDWDNIDQTTNGEDEKLLRFKSEVSNQFIDEIKFDDERENIKYFERTEENQEVENDETIRSKDVYMKSGIAMINLNAVELLDQRFNQLSY